MTVENQIIMKIQIIGKTTFSNAEKNMVTLILRFIYIYGQFFIR